MTCRAAGGANSRDNDKTGRKTFFSDPSQGRCSKKGRRLGGRFIFMALALPKSSGLVPGIFAIVCLSWAVRLAPERFRVIAFIGSLRSLG